MRAIEYRGKKLIQLQQNASTWMNFTNIHTVSSHLYKVKNRHLNYGIRMNIYCLPCVKCHGCKTESTVVLQIRIVFTFGEKTG